MLVRIELTKVGYEHQIMGLGDKDPVKPQSGDDGSRELEETVDSASSRDSTSSAGTSNRHTEGPGTTIGRYKLLQEIGEGGFGVVYMAEQKEPVKRRVALKIIKLGMDTRQVIARFEAERQALAMMDHPNIARVLDAGATAAGRPYFVMELVRGVAITEYCDREKLDLRQRQKLFGKVCRAVQHAHQKGIIHRDIKPSNVMVTLHDGQPVPKIIDFGVAKATSTELTQRTLFTRYEQMIGTPAYMSPEQAEMSGLDIDTRTDIYSLGVLLYELLTGTTPFNVHTLAAAALDQVQRIIREQEAPRPSVRLSEITSGTLEWTAPSRIAGDRSVAGSSIREIAMLRHTDPVSLRKQLCGDLDWIIMKCLEKERTRRYETAAALADDIQRHLNDEPVLASPPSAMYRFHKLFRRHKHYFIAASIIFLLLIGGIVGTTYGMLRARAAERLAVTEAEIAAAVNDFLNEDLLAAVTPSAEAGKGRDVLMREVLDEAALRIDEASQPGGRFADKPLVEAAVRVTIGNTYFELGEYDTAEPHLDRAVELRRRELGAENEQTLVASRILASLTLRDRRLQQADRMFREGFELSRRVLGEDDLETARWMAGLAVLSTEFRRYTEAEELYGRAIEIMTTELGEEHPTTLNVKQSRAYLYSRTVQFAKAEAAFSEIVATHRRVHGPDYEPATWPQSNLAVIYMNQKRYAEAEALFLSTLDIRRRILGEDHPSTLWAMSDLGSLYRFSGRFDEARQVWEDALTSTRRQLGQGHPRALQLARRLANLFFENQEPQRAFALMREALADARRDLGADHDETLYLMSSFGGMLYSHGDYEEAETLLTEALDGQRRVLGPLEPATVSTVRKLERLWISTSKIEKARRLIAELSATVPTSSTGYNELAWLLLTCEPADMRDPQKALEYALKANEQLPYENIHYLDTLARAQHLTGDTAAAVRTQRRMIEILPLGADNRPEYEQRLAEYESALGEQAPAQPPPG